LGERSAPNKRESDHLSIACQDYTRVRINLASKRGMAIIPLLAKYEMRDMRLVASAIVSASYAGVFVKREDTGDNGNSFII
jgi:hypothetical protein